MDFEQDEGYYPGLIESGGAWSLAPGLTGEILLGGASGAQSLSLGGGQWITFDANSPAPLSVTWVDFFTKPVFVDASELPEAISTEQSAVTGFVKVDAEGEVYAVDGDGLGSGAWTPAGMRTPLADNIAQNWIRLTYRIDYATKTWDLFVDGQMALTDLGFLDNTLNAFSRFSMRGDGEAPTAFDFFYAGEGNPLFVDTSNDGLPDDWLVSQGLNPAYNHRHGDEDLDGLDNLTEYMLSTRADNADTDGDGISDGMEYALGDDPLVADTYTLSVLPFVDGFETYEVGLPPLLNGWSVTGDSIAVQQGDVFSGQAALSLGEGATVFNRYNGSGSAVVWVDIYLKPTPSHEAPEVPENASVVYYFNEGGQPVAFDGLGSGSGFWTLLDAATSADWRRITVKADYQAQSYDIYVDGQRLGIGLGFAHTQPFLSRFEIQESTLVDDVSITAAEPAGLDDDRDGLDNATEAVLGTSPVAFDSDQDGLADSLEALWGLDPWVADTSVAIPTEIEPGVFYWATTFSVAEGYINGSLSGQYNWAASGPVNVSTDEDVSLEQASNDDLSFERLFGLGENRRVWVTFRAKLLVGAMPDVSTLSEPAVALMGFTDPETMVVWDAESQAWIEFPAVADPRDWNDYAIYLDYVNQAWSICQNGVLIADGLPFKDKNLTVFSRFKALQARLDQEPSSQDDPLVASFDDVTISNAEPTGLDYDGDGLDNDLERQLGSDILLADTDGDGMPDAWEYQYGLDLLRKDANTDMDGDGMCQLDEYRFGLDPQVFDAQGYAGLLNLDIWTSIGSSREVTGLTGNSRYPASPSVRTFVTSAEGERTYGDNYGSRLRGFIEPPVSGYYTFWIASDEDSELWLSTDDSQVHLVKIAWADLATGYRNWGKYAFQKSSEIYLEAGQRYAIEALHKEYNNDDYLSIAWQIPGQSRAVIGSEYIRSWAPDPADLDDDKLDDAWEVAHGLSATSGSGVNGYYGDGDGDGLLNWQEYQYGTNPLLADSDGDGYSDWAEVVERKTDPNAQDPVAWETVTNISASAAAPVVGEWSVSGGGLRNIDFRGSFRFRFSISNTGVYQLVLKVRRVEETPSSKDEAMSFRYWVDGESLGAISTPVESGTDTYQSMVLAPYLQAGEHTVEIFWNNFFEGHVIEVDSLLLQQPQFDIPEALTAWQQDRIGQIARVDAFPAQSLTSPVCLEGEGSYLTMMQSIPAADFNQGAGERWYANVPLQTEGTTSVSVSFQNGGKVESGDIEWASTNVFSYPSMQIRQGDALKLIAIAEGQQMGSATVQVEGDSPVTLVDEEAYVHRFEEAGSYTVTAAFVSAAGVSSQASMLVEVVGLTVPETGPAVWKNRERVWTWEGIPSEAAIEVEGMDVVVSSRDDDSVELGLKRDEIESEQAIVARLGEEGPVLGSVLTNGFDLTAVVEGLLGATTLEDGTLEVTNRIIVDRFPASASARISVFKAGVILDDGTTERYVDASEFSPIGTYDFLMYKPTSVAGSACHHIYAYEDGKQIGRR
jgi:hypothetical protein